MMNALRIVRWWLMSALFVAALGDLAIDAVDFHGLSRLCNKWVDNPADYCTNTYRLRCLPVPDDCHGFLAYLPPLQFNFHQIVPPDFARASILGYLWWGLEYAAGALWDGALFCWYVVRQPFAVNPLLWFVLIRWATAGGADAPVNPLLKLVQDQKALGDASTAEASAVHVALTGKSATPKQEFEY
jgi:hypothetical protein